jgi:hypothetical protein
MESIKIFLILIIIILLLHLICYYSNNNKTSTDPFISLRNDHKLETNDCCDPEKENCDNKHPDLIGKNCKAIKQKNKKKLKNHFKLQAPSNPSCVNDL